MYYMGVDVGSVSTNIVLLDNTLKVIEKLYLRTKGKPIKAIQDGLKILSEKYDSKQISSVGTTGSGRHMASFLIGADIVKNEITAHAVAALEIDKDVSTILEIGGQDSKIILLKNGIVTDFAMNTVCAAGTGSFIDRQAERLEIPIEDFGEYALKSKSPVRIAGRCAVFAESDMIHKQQLGYNEDDIIGGLCEAMVRNYLSNVGKGKQIRSKIFFQGGVAANIGIKVAFEKALGTEIHVPEHYDVMGAIGAAVLANEAVMKTGKTNFKGFEVAFNDFAPRNIECNGCGNNCEVIEIKDGEKTVGCFGDRCGKWSSKMVI
ncbi:acyl-CoA dehydratase activase [Clostridium sp. CM028]|uniref:acyl-CoA dehydratase activase n=1 Tax=unclassified Clostridium TaxID=2614128 RepID=UPI001C0DC0E0|nr:MULTISPECIES: acyl-CoA dehydratase activase [unclassified Clostridium]MBU3092172.1 2-hydroxyglutaryl-CoA dehydratase [Clostridium sp. CF011]MBW9146466.1 acyl-CoA dehydratase activase [Clostridium sp. CM027]MBW9149142.1 acyl-CoA dehydratase activase [Clostridium sp. CM028]UVE41966.1 2-hydroxyglutaryl-CoA dehydratase [Clostridium sp. CM027]WAG70986.1 acyl-CoA dehydratase activase [Clostridium sp. CF011]